MSEAEERMREGDVQWECVDEFHDYLMSILIDRFRYRKAILIQYLSINNLFRPCEIYLHKLKFFLRSES
jgi:hypothetical protein